MVMKVMSISKLASFATMLFFVLFSFFELGCCVGNICPAIEKQSLLSFKQSLQDPENKLSSWNDDEVNCCKWEGVLCSNLTGHVQQLHLQSSNLRGQIRPSLLNLKHLKYLDLRGNHFNETIPSFIGSLASLEYLDLSETEFHGMIPRTIGNLSNLYTLKLESTYSLEVDSLEWLSGLSKLEYLDMSGMNLRRASDWQQQVINKLSSLVELHLRECNLIYLDLSYKKFEGVINTTKLQHIDLSYNRFNSSIPEWLYLLKDLDLLNLRESKLQGAISNSIANLTSLSSLDLSNNELSGKLPRGLVTNLWKLKNLNLGWNQELQGEVSDLFGNVSDSFIGSLESLDLSVTKLSGPLTHHFGEFKFTGSLESLNLGGNQLSGPLTRHFGELTSLRSLDLSSNSLSGVIPSNIGNLSSLEYLDLQDNKFTGNLPESIGQLSNLQTLRSGYNMLEGVVSETHFSRLSRLEYLYGQENNLTLKVGQNWIPPFKLLGLTIGSWNLGSPIPRWLDTQKTSIEDLDLSNTGIYGNVPNWLWSIRFLDLSHNQLHGNIPVISDPTGAFFFNYLQGQYVYLRSNNFTGQLPRVGKWLSDLDLSNNSFSGDLSDFLCNTITSSYMLQNLHLGGNHLTGELPNCFMNLPSLRMLNLGNNDLSGKIPNSIGYLARLQSLNLNGNNFSGNIPLSMHNCTKLIKVDLSLNNLSGNLPKWILTSLSKLMILILKSNKLSGEITSAICQRSSLQILDLSDNKFSGMIPWCVDNFTAMASKISSRTPYYSFFVDVFLEYASIASKGKELTYGNTLFLVTSIDLSNNNLSGDIPKEITSLVELRTLNLSGNHLTGTIPDSIGNMKQLESLDFSMNSLSGELPNSFTLMSSLNYLNVSCNNLTGRIPKSTQLQSFNESSFIGNNLCGPPLTSSCSANDGKAPGTMHSRNEVGDKPKIEWLYVFISLGYAVGISAVLTTLFLKRSWREAYYEFLENICDGAYVYVHIKWRRLTRKSSGRNM